MAALRPETEFVLLGLTDVAMTLLRAVPTDSGAPEPFPVNVCWAKSTLYPLVTGYPIPGLPRVVPMRFATGQVRLYHATNYALPRSVTVPTVVTVHDLTLLRYPELGTRALRRLVGGTRRSVREATCVIADSESTKRDVVELLGVPEEKVHVVQLACDASFQPTDIDAARKQVALRFGLEDPYVLHVGTIEPRKNLERLIGAFSQARREHRLPHHLVLAGQAGWGATSVLRCIRGEQLEAVVHRLGVVSKDELRT
jgi:glycosyltransferase involved in cell wall biosynthesis